VLASLVHLAVCCRVTHTWRRAGGLPCKFILLTPISTDLFPSVMCSALPFCYSWFVGAVTARTVQFTHKQIGWEGTGDAKPKYLHIWIFAVYSQWKFTNTKCAMRLFVTGLKLSGFVRLISSSPLFSGRWHRLGRWSCSGLRPVRASPLKGVHERPKIMRLILF
jgi:hypothetical protein